MGSHHDSMRYGQGYDHGRGNERKSGAADRALARAQRQAREQAWEAERRRQAVLDEDEYPTAQSLRSGRPLLLLAAVAVIALVGWLGLMALIA